MYVCPFPNFSQKFNKRRQESRGEILFCILYTYIFIYLTLCTQETIIIYRNCDQ